jgi:glutaredoxin
MKWFDTLQKVVDKTDVLLDKVRKAPRKRLDFVPQPVSVPDPFGPAAPPKGAAAPVAPPKEKPLGDPSLAAQVYGKRTCEWTGRAVALLAEHGIDARFVNIADPTFEHFEMKLVGETKQYTLPYVYLKGEFVGGYDALAARLKASATRSEDGSAEASPPKEH